MTSNPVTIQSPARPGRRPLLRALALSPALVPGWARAGQMPTETAEVVVRRTVDDAFAVLKDRTLTGREQRPRRIAALRQVADRVFDWGEMARGSLGVHWRGLDRQQRSRFVAVFKDVLATQYMEDIDRFQGTETVTVGGSLREGEETVVRTTLVTASRERVPMDYRLRLLGGRWMIVDLSIEGVSLVNHFRRSFSDALVNMSIDQLIGQLSQQLPR